eukprot:TRINITY_DN14965_c0_g1_i1.p1 TRINITY_DN14965_c0_g1~~TRINITY_DN14965_c0_g1_i1.p1  ORF type:complete len:991 (+),score=238.02 TRINITY_DN14965_c0_g1_i1:70-2973(+)
MSISHKEQLTAFFNIYSKNNLGREDEMLSKRPGKEDAFFEQLEQRANCKFFTCVKELVDHYTKTDPAKIKTIIPAFTKFPKRELDVVAKIKGTSAAAKAPPAAAAPATPAQPSGGGGGGGGARASADVKASLIALSTAYNEGLIPKIDGLLTQHAGKEAALLKALDNKFCPQKNFFDTRDKIFAIFQKHNPDAVGSVDKLITGKLKGGGTATDQLLAAIIKKYGDAEVGAATTPAASEGKPPTPAAAAAGPSKPSSDWKTRLTSFLKEKNDPRAAKVDAILQQYSGKEQQVFKSLVEKLGPEGYWVSRLTRHFEKHKPPLVEQVDKLLKQHAGNEDKLIESLVKKFGPEPAAPAAAPAASGGSPPTPATDNMTWAAKVWRFYYYQSPGKLANAEALLKKEAGREKEVYAALVKRAGSDPTPKDPPATSDYKARLVNLLSMAQPQALSNTDAYLTKFKGNEEKLIQGLVNKHKIEEPCKPGTPGDGGAAPASSPPSWRDRLTAFFTKYNPDNIPKIDGILQKYKDNLPGLMEGLVKKYGPEPTPPSSSSSPQLSYRDRVVAIYKKYNPEKEHQVETIMSQFAGREPLLISQLVAKYGPEPPPPGQLTLKERLVRLYMKYNPEKVSTVPGIIEKYGNDGEELMKKLVEKYGPEPTDDEEEEDERTKQQRLDAMEWSSLSGPMKVTHENERAGRWEIEDDFTSILSDISKSMKKGEAYVEKLIVANNLSEQNATVHQKLCYSRWFAAFKERIRLEKKRHRELLDQRMSIYDQLQTNSYSIKYYERQAKKKASEKEKRQSKFKAGIQPKVEPTKKKYEKDFVGYNMRMASCSPAQRSASVASRSRSRSAGKVNAPETVSPTVLTKVLTYQKKWLPKTVEPPEYPSRCFEPDAIPKRFSRRPIDRSSVSLQSIVGTGETAVERAIREMRQQSDDHGRAGIRSKSSDFPHRSPSNDSTYDYFPSKSPSRLPVY